MIQHQGIDTNVFVNSHGVNIESASVLVADLLTRSGFSSSEHWSVYRLHDGNKLGELLSCDADVAIQDGD